DSAGRDSAAPASARRRHGEAAGHRGEGCAGNGHTLVPTICTSDPTRLLERRCGPMTPALARAIEEGRDELTLEEARQFAEEQTQKYFGMSVDEFRRVAQAGELPEDDPMVVHVALLAGVDLLSC